MAVVNHSKKCLKEDDAFVTFLQLKEALPWQYDDHYFHRGFFRYGDESDPLTAELINPLIRTFEEHAGRDVRGIFCNYYRSGNDYCSFHQDSYGSDVLTLSLGGTRDCLVKKLEGGKSDKYTLENGDFFYFNTRFNELHKHSIPKRSEAGERISVVAFLQ